MASLSVRRNTSLVAGPLGTLPTFADTTCAQDTVVATSNIRLHNLAKPKAPLVKVRGLSAPSLFTIPSGTFFLALSRLFVARFLFSTCRGLCLCGFNQSRETSHLHSAVPEYPHARHSNGEPGNTQPRQFVAAYPTGARNQ